MSDASLRTDGFAKPKAPKAVTFPGVDFQIPKFEIPKFEMPLPIRELAEKGGAQAKEHCEKVKAATDKVTDMVEATYASSTKGVTDYGLKVIEMTRANTDAAFDFIDKLPTVKSPSEAVELLTAHARQQFDAVSAQNKELVAFAQKGTADAVEAIKGGMSKAFENNNA
jgi:phasin